MILSTPGNPPYNVPGKDLRVQASLDLPDKAMDEFGSGTDTVAGGSAPKKLSVALRLPFTGIEELRALLSIAEAVDDTGDRLVYDVVDMTARAYNIRQVAFTGTVAAKEMDDLQAWNVSFTLIERRSIAELRDGRLPTHEVSGKTVDGDPLAGKGDTDFAKVLDATKGI